MTRVTPDELRTMSVEELLKYRRHIDDVLSERRVELERQLEQITGARPAKQNSGNTRVEWRYRSKKNPSLVWSGRGVLPRWMREEIKGTKLTKEDFRIKPR